jgi:hypothetical protein
MEAIPTQLVDELVSEVATLDKRRRDAAMQPRCGQSSTASFGR